MKLGIMQPYFFPYLGYFDLINYSDAWIVFDTVQYIRHGWINRNRILHPRDGWSYMIVPVHYGRELVIKDVSIADDGKWKQRIIGQLQHYKKHAPYFSQTMELVQDCLDAEEQSISALNVAILGKVCEWLGIKFEPRLFSKMEMQLGPVEGPGDWALEISRALHAEEYVNPPGGAALFDQERFAASGIKLTIRQMPAFEYACPGYSFVPNLSILDVLMWNPVEAVKAHLGGNQRAEIHHDPTARIDSSLR
jgi:hypothetical protein